VRIAGDWSADLIVRQSLEYSGSVAAERLGLAHASVADTAHSALDRRHEVAAALNGLRAAAALPPDPDGDMVYRYRAARTVLADPAYTQRAKEMQQEMAALPGTERAVALLEALHHNLLPQPAANETG
jgi:hypothetical protein